MLKHRLAITILLFYPSLAFAQSNDYPVFSSSIPPPNGLYAASGDYLNLHPSDTVVLFVHVPEMEGDGINNFYRKKQNGKRGEKINPKEYFAASDGNTFYISYQGEWYKAKKTNGTYCFLAPYKPPHEEKAPHAHIVFGSSYDRDRLDLTSMAENKERYRMTYSVEKQSWIPGERVKR